MPAATGKKEKGTISSIRYIIHPLAPHKGVGSFSSLFFFFHPLSEC